jgi:hypothetical protein
VALHYREILPLWIAPLWSLVSLYRLCRNDGATVVRGDGQAGRLIRTCFKLSSLTKGLFAAIIH